MSGAQPGPARWWLVDLERDQTPSHDLVRAPSRRQALASYRADMIVFFSAHESRRWAAARVRALGLVVIDGPLAPREAFEHALGWAWAWEITRRESRRTTVAVEPLTPASRADAERELGPDLARKIEKDAAAAYLDDPAAAAPAPAPGRPPTAGEEAR